MQICRATCFCYCISKTKNEFGQNPEENITLIGPGPYYILIDWVWGNSKFIVPETLTIDRGEAKVNSQGRGDKKLAIPEYTVKIFIKLVVTMYIYVEVYFLKRIKLLWITGETA
jgi:hypothetical protein